MDLDMYRALRCIEADDGVGFSVDSSLRCAFQRMKSSLCKGCVLHACYHLVISDTAKFLGAKANGSMKKMCCKTVEQFTALQEA